MKTEKSECALKEWIFELPFTQQAVLMLATRGADGMPKNNSAKPIIHYLRDVVIKAAYPYMEKESYHVESFMCNDYYEFANFAKAFFSDTDAYPMHFLLHLFHAAEIIGYSHPNQVIREQWKYFYEYACKSLHMKPETKEQLFKRLSK